MADAEDDIIKITEQDIEEYYAPIPAEQLPDADIMMKGLEDLLLYLGTDDASDKQATLGGDNEFRAYLEDKFPGDQMKIIVEYVMDGRPLDDLIATIDAFRRIKGGESYDDVHAETQDIMKKKYIPEELLEMDKVYNSDTESDKLIEKLKNTNYSDLDRKTRRKIERLAKKQNKKSR